MMLQPDVDLARMQQLGWFDSFTDKATLSALVYTEGIEMFTLLSVEFVFDPAGNVESNIRTWSWKDLIGVDKDTLLIREILLLVFAGLGLAHTARLIQTTQGTASNFRYFELFTRGLLFAISFAVVIWRSGQNEMGDAFEEALQAFLSVEGPRQDPDALKATDAFFVAADSLRSEAETLNWFCLMCYVVGSLQLAQLVVYFHEAHPGMALFTKVMQRALMSLLHLLVLLLLFYVLLAFLLHWMFGRSLAESETFGRGITSQLKMIYGDYVRLPGVTSLDDDAATAYWIYAVIFMTVAFFLARFVFLAILVEAYAEVKKMGTSTASPRNFLSDGYYAITVPIRGAANDWPSHEAVITWLQAGPVMDTPLLRREQLNEAFGTYLKEAPFCDNQGSPVDTYIDNLAIKAPETILFLASGQDLRLLPAEARQARSVSEERPASSKRPSGGERERPARAAPSEMDVKNVARNVVRQVTNELAQRELSDVNWLAMTGKVTTTLYREFSQCGLIPDKRS